jgi:hypothetical protein
MMKTPNIFMFFTLLFWYGCGSLRFSYGWNGPVCNTHDDMFVSSTIEKWFFDYVLGQWWTHSQSKRCVLYLWHPCFQPKHSAILLSRLFSSSSMTCKKRLGAHHGASPSISEIACVVHVTLPFKMSPFLRALGRRRILCIAKLRHGEQYIYVYIYICVCVYVKKAYS